MKKIVLLAMFVCEVLFVFAQMSDAQVVSMLQTAYKQGKSQQEIIIMLGQKGVTQEQLMRIKKNYEQQLNTQKTTSSSESAVTSRVRAQEQASQGDDTAIPENKSENEKEKENGEDVQNQSLVSFEVFGRDVFTNAKLTFEPNINIATPETYILGPGDEVIIDIWGDAQQTLQQQISPDGTITDVAIGPIVLGGLSLKEANIRLKNVYASIYSTMNAAQPTTFMRMSLGKIRSIRINVVGEVLTPGTYTLPSLASLFHALYSAGGVNDIGSLRCIKICRGGEEIAEVDVYEYLLQGKSDVDIRLEEGDVIIVPPYQNLVNVQGKVKRPMIYEMKEGECVKDILQYAGGFRGDSYKETIRLIRKSGREHQVFSVDRADFHQFALTDGDEITVDAILERFENRVEIKGAVYREGVYALRENIATVRQLIEKAEGVRGDAFLNRAVLYREKADLTREVLSVDVKGVLEGTVEDIELRNNDVLYIPSIFDLQEEYTVRIGGAVNHPGVYKFADGMSIEDMVVQAGGLKESASVVKIDVARRIKNPRSTETSSVLAENYTLTLKNGFLVEGDKDFVLKPFDEVFVRNSPGYQAQQSVVISGEALFAGEYVISNKGERLSDLVKKAGGLTPEAYIAGARLIRQLNADEDMRVQAVLKFAGRKGMSSVDTGTFDVGKTYYVGIELAKALEHPGSEHDIVLREGDVLHIPEYVGTVKVSGSVMHPTTIVYQKGAKLKDYIKQCGGFANRAKRNRIYVIYMNGTVSKGKSFDKSKDIAGCEIIVPSKPPRLGSAFAEIMGVATSATSLAAMVTSIINNMK